MDSEVRRKVVELRYAKRYGEALELVRKLADEGDDAASVMIARMWDAAGLNRAEADALIDAAHLTAHPEDVEAHLELYGAYAEGLGNVPHDVKARRSFDHLLTAAEHDAGASYSLTLARIYRVGALSVPQDHGEAERWYRKAGEQGSKDALSELATLPNGGLGSDRKRAN